MIGKKKIYQGKLYKWREYIQNQIESGDWLNILHLALDIYKGKNHMLCGFNENNTPTMKMYYNDIIKKYIEHISNIFCCM